jgi:hypothetical protein
METIEQYLSILKELNTIETRVNRLAAIFTQNGRNELDDLLVSGLNLKAQQLAVAASQLSTIEQYIPPTDSGEVPTDNGEIPTEG